VTYATEPTYKIPNLSVTEAFEVVAEIEEGDQASIVGEADAERSVANLIGAARTLADEVRRLSA